MLRTFKVAIAVSLVAVATGLTAAPQKRATARRSAPARAVAPTPRPFDPKTYAASVEGVDCTNVAARAKSVVPIEKALHGIASSYPWGPPTKGEFESTTAFDQRVHDELSAKLGGTDRIVAGTAPRSRRAAAGWRARQGLRAAAAGTYPPGITE